MDMNAPVFCTAGQSDALQYAIDFLKHKGCTVIPQPDKTASHLLLPVPSFDESGRLRGGGDLASALELLPRNVTVLGGNFGDFAPAGYRCVDLLQDPFYLAENADITAHCAVKLAQSHLSVTLRRCPVLVVGWGRIGKCLAALLKSMGAAVTVAVRKPSDRAMLEALGYESLSINTLSYELLRFRVVFNTAPVMVLSKEKTQHCRPDCLLIDLASTLGIEADDVIWARGLPSKDAPESSGELIARTVLRKGGSL
jgi:dipicolinate synthase subunit A